MRRDNTALMMPILGLLVFALLTLPWLNPFAAGPSPGLIPWLFSAMAAALGVMVGLMAARGAPTSDQRGAFAHGLRWPYWSAWAWLTAGLLSAAMGLLQYFGASAGLQPWVNLTAPGEAFANLRQRNQFASLTNMALAALICLVALKMCAPTDTKKTNRSDHLTGLALPAAALLAVGTAASASRTGMLQLALLCVLAAVWGLWRQVQIRRLLLTAVLAYGLAVFLLPVLAGLDPSVSGIVARLRAGDAPCASRLTLWSNVLHLIAQKPWLGWGWGELDYAHFMTLYNQSRFCDILDNAHNLPLHLAVELGVPLALMVCSGAAWWVLRQRPWQEADPVRQMAWTVLAVIGLHSLLEYPLWYGPFQMAVSLCVLLLGVRRAKSTPPSRSKPAAQAIYPIYPSNKPLVTVFIASVAMIIIAFGSYAAWDYHRISQIYLAPEARSKAYQLDTLEKIRPSWLFSQQVRFAELVTTPLSPANAQWTFDTAQALLHYSPEQRVIEKVIESAVMLGRDDDALAYLARYKAAFPADHARWALALTK